MDGPLPALHVHDGEEAGYRWIAADDAEGSVVAYARLGGDQDRPVVVVANFTPVVREGYRVGVPRAGYWREILNSDAEAYGGSGVGNRGGMHSDGHGAHGLDQSLIVTIPPLAICVFAHE